MILKPIQNNWGTVIEFDNPLDFFKVPAGYWRNLIYQRHLLVFKKMNFDKIDYAKFSLHFGDPWKNLDYSYSEEHKEDIDIGNGQIVTLSPFSNKTSSRRIKTEPMPYHADIPNRSFRPFPFRSLWITKNPRPDISGITGFLNVTEDAFKCLTPAQQELLHRVKIIQQSWYEPGTDIQEHSLIKTHPVTGLKSLRLNYYNTANFKGAWICGVKIDETLQSDCSLIPDFIKQLLKFQELQYFHTWDTYDIAIYDNYSFIHNRTSLILEENEERHFYRINIDHVSSDVYKI
jgi:alpha-ketoglutarate-dependent taurine dioxygenase